MLGNHRSAVSAPTPTTSTATVPHTQLAEIFGIRIVIGRVLSEKKLEFNLSQCCWSVWLQSIAQAEPEMSKANGCRLEIKSSSVGKD